MASTDSIFWHRARRVIASGSPVLLASGLVIAGFAATNIRTGLSLSNTLVWGVLIVAILLLLFQMRAEYWKRTYDPTLLMKFTDEFHGKDMRPVRCRASKFLKTRSAKLADCEDADLNELLDFFDQVGFFLKGDQLTAEAAYHAFHYWIRGYWSAAWPYVRAVQSEEGRSTWEYVEVLFNITDQIDREKSTSTSGAAGLLDQEETRKFLDREIKSTAVNQ